MRKCANLSCNNLFSNLLVSKYITFFPNDKTIVELNKLKIIDVDTFLINFKKCIDIHLSQKNSVELLHNKSKIKKSVKKRTYQNKNNTFQNSVHDIEEKINDFKRVFKKQI